jgi:hypothetical protein
VEAVGGDDRGGIPRAPGCSVASCSTNDRHALRYSNYIPYRDVRAVIAPLSRRAWRVSAAFSSFSAANAISRRAACIGTAFFVIDRRGARREQEPHRRGGVPWIRRLRCQTELQTLVGAKCC